MYVVESLDNNSQYKISKKSFLFVDSPENFRKKID